MSGVAVVLQATCPQGSSEVSIRKTPLVDSGSHTSLGLTFGRVGLLWVNQKVCVPIVRLKHTHLRVLTDWRAQGDFRVHALRHGVRTFPANGHLTN